MTPNGAFDPSSVQPGDFLTLAYRGSETVAYVVRVEWQDDLVILRLVGRGTENARWVEDRVSRDSRRILGAGAMGDGDPRLPRGI